MPFSTCVNMLSFQLIPTYLALFLIYGTELHLKSLLVVVNPYLDWANLILALSTKGSNILPTNSVPRI